MAGAYRPGKGWVGRQKGEGGCPKVAVGRGAAVPDARATGPYPIEPSNNKGFRRRDILAAGDGGDDARPTSR